MRRRSELGATAVEYAIMVGLIAVVVIVGALALGNVTNDTLQCAGDSIDQGQSQCPSTP